MSLQREWRPSLRMIDFTRPNGFRSPDIDLEFTSRGRHLIPTSGRLVTDDPFGISLSSRLDLSTEKIMNEPCGVSICADIQGGKLHPKWRHDGLYDEDSVSQVGYQTPKKPPCIFSTCGVSRLPPIFQESLNKPTKRKILVN